MIVGPVFHRVAPRIGSLLSSGTDVPYQKIYLLKNIFHTV